MALHSGKLCTGYFAVYMGIGPTDYIYIILGQQSPYGYRVNISNIITIIKKQEWGLQTGRTVGAYKCTSSQYA